jgi:hypothetical protein
LRTCAGAHIGDCLLLLDLARIRRDLEYLPWIRSAAVERVRPHTLRIRVRERKPIAQTRLYQPLGASGPAQDVVFYFDAEGYAMLPLEVHRAQTSALGLDTLPLLTGLAGTDLRPGHRSESRQILSALRLITTFQRSSMLGKADLTSIDLAVPHLLEVTTSRGAQVVFSVQHLEMQLRRWRLVHEYGLGEGKAIATLDLSVSNNVPARWFEGGAAPPAAPMLFQHSPSSLKKKHV